LLPIAAERESFQRRPACRHADRAQRTLAHRDGHRQAALRVEARAFFRCDRTEDRKAVEFGFVVFQDRGLVGIARRERREAHQEFGVRAFVALDRDAAERGLGAGRDAERDVERSRVVIGNRLASRDRGERKTLFAQRRNDSLVRGDDKRGTRRLARREARNRGRESRERLGGGTQRRLDLRRRKHEERSRRHRDRHADRAGGRRLRERILAHRIVDRPAVDLDLDGRRKIAERVQRPHDARPVRPRAREQHADRIRRLGRKGEKQRRRLHRRLELLVPALDRQRRRVCKSGVLARRWRIVGKRRRRTGRDDASSRRHPARPTHEPAPIATHTPACHKGGLRDVNGGCRVRPRLEGRVLRLHGCRRCLARFLATAAGVIMASWNAQVTRSEAACTAADGEAVTIRSDVPCARFL
jgi:hypothetical protein